jgi:hypothetical protein
MAPFLCENRLRQRDVYLGEQRSASEHSSQLVSDNGKADYQHSSGRVCSTAPFSSKPLLILV